MDFIDNTLYCGKRFRSLNILDEGTRKCLAIEIDSSIPAGRVVCTLESLKSERGLPKQIRVDNGSELILKALTDWCEEHQIKQVYIEAWLSHSRMVLSSVLLAYSEENF